MWHAEKMLGFIFIIIIIYLFPFAATVTFSVHWNINIRHQDEKLVGEIGERGTSYVFTAWHSERSLKLLKSWFYSWISRLFPINSEMRLRAFIYLSWIEDCSFIRCLGIQCSFFFVVCIFFLEAPLFPVVYSPLCFGCFCYCEPVNTFCTEYKKPFSS